MEEIIIEPDTYPGEILKIDKDLFSGYYKMPDSKRCAGEDLEITEQLKNPIGTKPINELIKGKSKILIISDDNTRHTPAGKILNVLFRETGIKKENTTILIGSGTHRPMTSEEIVDKFGPEIAGSVKIVNHNWNNMNELYFLGKTPAGTEIYINKIVRDADFIMGIGNIVPHATVGFSGGSKIVVPGICGEKTCEEIHWKALDYDLADLLGNNDNPMRKEMNAIAKKAGLRFIINTVLTPDGHICKVVCGDPVLAHQRGAEICKEVYGVGITQKADIVIADAYGTDIDLRQAVKGLLPAAIAIKKGGIIILLAACPDGVAPQFPQYLELGFKEPYKLKEKVEKKEINFKLGAYTLVVIGKIMADKAKVILVSKGVSKEETEKLGFLWAGSPGEALEKARRLTGKEAKVIFLKRAGELLPLIN